MGNKDRSPSKTRPASTGWRWDILFFAVAAVAMLVLAGWALFAQG